MIKNQLGCKDDKYNDCCKIIGGGGGGNFL